MTGWELFLLNIRNSFNISFYMIVAGWGRKKNKVWKSIWNAAVWSLWCHRNKIIFEDNALRLGFCVGNY